MARDCKKGKVIGIVINPYYNYNLHLLNYNEFASSAFVRYSCDLDVEKYGLFDCCITCRRPRGDVCMFLKH